MLNYAQKMENCSQYVDALEVERKKIQVFQRELPLCLELVSQAIDACRQQLSGNSEQTSSHGPVLEEFIPINRAADADADVGCGGGSSDESGKKFDEKCGEKSDWLRSVQLWNNQSADPAPVTEVKKDGGGFRPFNKETVVKLVEIVENNPASSTTMKIKKVENNNKENENDSAQMQRKQRRCWSPELHKRFIYALQQLGGPHVATPKQIKELMKVDGLTNDEVKSHLQKYRLHMRRPSAAMRSDGHGPQVVVVGGIWVPPPEYATPAEASNVKKDLNSPRNGIYAPVAKVGTQISLPTSNHSGSHCEDDRSNSAHGRARAYSSSPVSSSSTHTTPSATTSPVLS